MSSEFDQYFQEFLADDSNEFNIFTDDFGSEQEGLHHSDDGQLQDRSENSFDSTTLEDLIAPSLTSNTNPGLWREPETDVSTGGTPSVLEKGTMSLNNTPPTIASPSPCLWISCSTRSAERNEAEMAVHLGAHWKETHSQWLGPRGCNWPDCPSKATFKSPSSLKSHIFNIHISPLVCTHPQCTYPNPFGKPGDLRRHIETVHEASSNHTCPVESCEANIKGFARKDKLLNHIREQHDNLRCPYNHCYATVLETEQDAHLQQFHGSFECALGSCGKGPASCFLEVGLRRHFRRYHNMTFDPAHDLLSRVKRTEDHTARSIHIVRLKKLKDCPACSETQSALGFAQNSEDFQTQSEDRTSQG